MIKLVACDLDGTLLDEAHQLPLRNIQAIHNLQQAGITFMAATGRNYQSVAPMFEKEGIRCDCLLLNGALITDA
ncbi:MAG: HAD family hydrolase, partial [Clostridium sp.]